MGSFTVAGCRWPTMRVGVGCAIFSIDAVIRRFLSRLLRGPLGATRRTLPARHGEHTRSRGCGQQCVPISVHRTKRIGERTLRDRRHGTQSPPSGSVNTASLPVHGARGHTGRECNALRAQAPHPRSLPASPRHLSHGAHAIPPRGSTGSHRASPQERCREHHQHSRARCALPTTVEHRPDNTTPARLTVARWGRELDPARGLFLGALYRGAHRLLAPHGFLYGSRLVRRMSAGVGCLNGKARNGLLSTNASGASWL